MNRIIVDANIVFSGMLNINSKIGDILINQLNLEMIAPEFLRVEIKKYHSKIAKYLDVKIDEVKELDFYLTKNIIFISEDIVPLIYWKNAESLAFDIDEKDTPYIAYSLFFNAPIWTGDKKLIKGMNSKNFTQFISTNELHKVMI